MGDPGNAMCRDRKLGGSGLIMQHLKGTDIPPLLLSPDLNQDVFLTSSDYHVFIAKALDRCAEL